MDTRKYIQLLQECTVSLLKEGNEDKPLWMLAKYNCSEISWLIGLKVLSDLGPESRPFTLKGDVNNGIEKIENIHDILGYFSVAENKYVVIDPTIWQFYPQAESIFIGTFSTKEEAASGVSKYYDGVWKLSYYIDEIDEDEQENRRIVRKNCDQAPNWE